MALASTVNGIFGLIGNEQQFASSKKLMAKQHHYNKQYAEYVGSNAMQWTAKDLEKAGFNRVLAVNNGANSTSGGGVGLPQAPDYAGSLQSAVQTYMDNKRIQNETEVAQSTTNVNDATANNQKAQADATKKESGWIDNKANAEIRESESRTAKNRAEKSQIESNTELIKAKRIEALNNSGLWGQYLLYKHFGGQNPIELTSKKLKELKKEHEEKMKKDPKYKKMWEEADLTEGIFGY